MSEAIPFLKLFIPLARSPIKADILPLPKSNIAKIAIIVLGPKDFPIMLKKVGSWIGTAKKYINNIQNEVSNIDLEENNIEKYSNKENNKMNKDEE